MCEKSSSADPKVSAEGGQEVLPALEQRFPAAHGADHGEAGCPCSQGGPWGSRSTPAPQGGPHAGAKGCPKQAVTPWGAHAGASSCQDLWTSGERSPHQSRGRE